MIKKISQIAAYSILCVLVLSIIMCAIIKVDNKPQMETGYSIQVTDTEATNIGEKISDEYVEKFNKKMNDSFKISVLYALFSGKINNRVTMSTSTTLPTFSGYKVQLIYTEEKTLYDNGKAVNKSNGSSDTVKYDTIVFSVLSQKNLSKVDVYYYLHTQSGNYYKFSTVANFDDLYNFIAELPNIKK